MGPMRTHVVVFIRAVRVRLSLRVCVTVQMQLDLTSMCA